MCLTMQGSELQFEIDTLDPVTVVVPYKLSDGRMLFFSLLSLIQAQPTASCCMEPHLVVLDG